MNIKQIALVLGAAALVVSGGVGSVACSSSSGGGTSSGSSSSGGNKDSGSSSDTGTNEDSGGGDSGGSSSGSSSGGSSSGCKADPTLHPGTAGSIFCGYTDAGSFSCMTGQQCCLGGKEGSGYAPEQCAMFGSTCTNGMGPLPVECQQPSDCTANGQMGAACCLQGTPSPPAPVAGCDMGDLISHGGSGIMCEMPGTGGGDAGASDAGVSSGACAAGELQVCEAPGDCPSGKTCTPIRWKLYQIGVCL